MISSFPFSCGVLKFKPKLSARSVYPFWRSSKIAIIPGSPLRSPAAINCVASADFPVPEGPATRRLSPSRTPPPIILSNSGKPTTPRWFLGFEDESQRAREGLQAAIADADGVQSRHRILSAHFHDLQFS